MINTFILEGELVGIHEDSIDLQIENNIKINVLTSPAMINMINELESNSLIVGIQGRFIQDDNKDLKIFMDKFSFVHLEQTKSEPNKKHTDKSR